MHRLRQIRFGTSAGWQAAAFGVLSAVGMAVRLFVPSPVAMANNGDAQRLMCQVRADAGAAPKLSAQWYFARFHFAYEPPHTPCADYPTTQYLQLRLTAWVHRHVLGLSGAVDTRELMIEYCVLVGLVIALMAWLLRSTRPLLRIPLLVALFVVLAEAGFADYAGSPYSELAAFYGVLIVAVVGVVMVAGGRARRIAFFVAWAAAVLAVGAKNEMVTLLLPLGLLLGTRRVEVGRLRGRIGARVLPALCVASLLATAGWSLAHQSKLDEKINTAQELTMTIMPMAHDPGTVAVDFGLPRSFGEYSGTNWWTAHPIEKDPLFARYESRFSRANLGRYLAENPVMAARVFSGGADAYLTFRNTYLGTYPVNAGYPIESQECRVCVLQDVSHAMKWSGFFGVAAYWLLCLAGAAWLVRTSAPRSRRRGFGLVVLTLLGCTLTQYATSVYGEGAEVTKHLSLALFAAALAPVWLACGALQEGLSPAAPSRIRLRITSSLRRGTSHELDAQPTAYVRQNADL